MRTQAIGINAAAALINGGEYSADEFLTPLFNALTESQIPSTKCTAIRMLAKLGEETDISISEFDERLANIFRDGHEMVRRELALNMSTLVIQSPNEFPNLISIYLRSIIDTNPELAETSIKTLATIISKHPSLIEHQNDIVEDIKEANEKQLVSEPLAGQAIELIRS